MSERRTLEGIKVVELSTFVAAPVCARMLADMGAQVIKVEGFKLDLRTPESCASYEELLEYAARHGYKRGWAYYQARRRGLIA